MAEARIQVPPQVRRGEAFEVKVLIRHAMETGYRLTDEGKPIARNVIRLLTCRYNGVEVFRAEPSSGIAANPLFIFLSPRANLANCSLNGRMIPARATANARASL